MNTLMLRKCAETTRSVRPHPGRAGTRFLGPSKAWKSQLKTQRHGALVGRVSDHVSVLRGGGNLLVLRRCHSKRAQDHMSRGAPARCAARRLPRWPACGPAGWRVCICSQRRCWGWSAPMYGCPRARRAGPLRPQYAGAGRIGRPGGGRSLVIAGQLSAPPARPPRWGGGLSRCAKRWSRPYRCVPPSQSGAGRGHTRARRTAGAECRWQRVGSRISECFCITSPRAS